MNLEILSDLHLEFHGPYELEFIDSLDKEGIDIVVVAGDLCHAAFLENTIETLCKQYLYYGLCLVGQASSPSEVLHARTEAGPTSATNGRKTPSRRWNLLSCPLQMP